MIDMFFKITCSLKKKLVRTVYYQIHANPRELSFYLAIYLLEKQVGQDQSD